MESSATFVVPCYNYGRYVQQAVDSLLDQTFRALDVIVVDDASTDETPEVLSRYHDEPRVRVIRHVANHGHVRSYNEGLRQATGDFVGLLSADDFAVSREAVARQAAVFEAHPEVGFVWSGPGIVDADGRLIHTSTRHAEDYVSTGLEELRHHLVWEDQVQHSGTMIRRECLRQVGMHDETIPHACDWDLWFRLASRYSVGYIAAPLYGYRIHTTNMSHAGIGAVQSIRELTRVIDLNFDRLSAAAVAELGHLRHPARRHAALHTLWLDLAYGRTGRVWRGLAAAPAFAPRVLLDRGFYAAFMRTLHLTLLGRARYRRRFGGFDV